MARSDITFTGQMLAIGAMGSSLAGKMLIILSDMVTIVENGGSVSFNITANKKPSLLHGVVKYQVDDNSRTQVLKFEGIEELLMQTNNALYDIITSKEE